MGFSRDGRLLALSENYTVKLWDTATLRELPALTVPNSINFPQGDAFISFSEDGKRIATGGIRHRHDYLGNRNRQTTLQP